MTTPLLNLIIQRLKTISDFKKVRGMVTYEAMLQQSLPNPSCFVYHLNNIYRDNENMSSVSQPVEQLYAVSVVYANIQVTDETTPFLAEELNKKVGDLMLGWQPFGRHPFLSISSKPIFEQNRYIRENIFMLEDCVTAEYRSN